MSQKTTPADGTPLPPALALAAETLPSLPGRPGASEPRPLNTEQALGARLRALYAETLRTSSVRRAG